MVQISEVRGSSRDNRTAAHSHIKGLGLNANGIAEKQAAGFVGQTAAREVCVFFSFFSFLFFSFSFAVQLSGGRYRGGSEGG